MLCIKALRLISLTYLGRESDTDGGERVEQPGEGGGADELLLRLEEALSAGLARK